MDPKWSGQKAFLANREGLESGLMIVQYVAASIISELQLLSNPTTTSNIPVSMGKEDHVSMGATGTYRSFKATKLLSQALANELVCSSEALDRISETPGDGVSKIHKLIRTIVAPLENDRSLTKECESLSNAILLGEISKVVE